MNLNDVKQKFSKSVGNTQSLLIIGLVILFLIATFVIYKKFVLKGGKKNYVANKEYNSEEVGIQSADIYFFYTEWCPHCKTAKPIWFDFKKQMEGERINGIKLHFFEVDCDKDTETSDKFKVKGFPTIKLVKGKQTIEYDAKPSVATLREFVNSALGN